MLLSGCQPIADRRERRDSMKKWFRNFWNDTRGQDLIEYALMAGFVAVAAGAIMPSVSTSISTIFSKIGSVLVAGGG
jgi:pilus assembly protein Flp/PilA